MRLLRVFPRKTKATPDDSLAVVNREPLLFDEADEVHVSVAFTWDKPVAEKLAERWRQVAPVRVGGVAYGDRGSEFVPGRYIKRGYTFTSRGCPRKCKFCSVPLRDPKPRLLPITDGWNILDDNLLATPRAHVEAPQEEKVKLTLKQKRDVVLNIISESNRQHEQILRDYMNGKFKLTRSHR